MNSNNETTAQNAYDKMAEEYAERVDEAPFGRTSDSVRASFGGLLDAERPATVTTTVLLRLFDDLRALVARESSPAVPTSSTFR